MRIAIACVGIGLALASAAAQRSPLKSGPWKRHVIDSSSRGADGVRMADINGDGRADIVTGWEEGGVIRVYLNPGAANARQEWPAVTVGRVESPEDAVFFDVDGDGVLDVVSSCEGRQRSMFVHWAPRRKESLLNPEAWRTEPLPAARNAMRWMFAVPLQVDGRGGVDLVAGGRDAGAQLGWFEAAANPRRLADWKWHPLIEAGWIMSIVPLDMDGDGDTDILVSDRKGGGRGVFWLERPNKTAELTRRWRRHDIGALGQEVMFLSTADLDGDGLLDVLTAVKPRFIYFHRRLDGSGLRWNESRIPFPETAGTAKAVRAGDIDGDGQLDLVFTCEAAPGDKVAVMWLSRSGAVDISGAQGTKYDLLELVDLDADGDLDVLTCEETDGLGVIWYENPAKP